MEKGLEAAGDARISQGQALSDRVPLGQRELN
jgi:hypothetical protein